MEIRQMVIREEREAVFCQICDLVKIASETAKVSNGDERNFDKRLWKRVV
jgi:hypothetical protein